MIDRDRFVNAIDHSVERSNRRSDVEMEWDGVRERGIEAKLASRSRSRIELFFRVIGAPLDHSSRNFVGTREVDETSAFDAFTYFTIVGMCPFVSFSFPCIIPLVGSSSPRMTVFQSA